MNPTITREQANHILLSAFRYAHEYAPSIAVPIANIIKHNVGVIDPPVKLTIQGEIGDVTRVWGRVSLALDKTQTASTLSVGDYEWELLLSASLNFDVRFAPFQADWYAALFEAIRDTISQEARDQLIHDMTWYGPTRDWEKAAQALQDA